MGNNELPKETRGQSKIDEFIRAGDVWTGRRSNKTAEQLLPGFIDELAIRGSPSPEIKDAIHDFLIDVIIPISWYSRKIRRANIERISYIFANAVLIVLLPTAIAFLPKIVP